MKRKTGFKNLIVLSLGLLCVGCSNNVLDPTQIGRFRPVPVVNVILESLGVADEPEARYAGAEDPRPEDVIPYEQDYVFGVGDIVRITIYELRSEGVPFVNDYIVTETGRISIPDVGQLRALGLTESRLEEEIKRILSPSILKDPSVTAVLMQSQSQFISIYGQGVGRSMRMTLPRYNMRLTDAIASAGGVGEFNVSYIYVSREISGQEAMSLMPEEISGGGERGSGDGQIDGALKLRPVGGEAEDKDLGPEDRMLDIIAPYANGGIHEETLIASSEMITVEELERLDRGDGFHRRAKGSVQLSQMSVAGDMVGNSPSNDTDPGGPQRVEWVFEEGRWKPIRVGSAPEVGRIDNGTRVAQQPPFLRESLPLHEPSPPDYGWDQIGGAGSQTRVIKIPVDKLLGGDPRYDIIIRSRDRISVPVDIIGEFWVMGNVLRSGPIPLVGRPMTLKMAIATAGLGPLAWPQKVEVIRRVGKNKAGLMQEETVLVDLDKIAKGLQPDFFIKPFDLINVGTHGTSRWQAVLRNAFRATYGFGFIYDRNFATPDFGQFNTFDGVWDDFNRML